MLHGSTGYMKTPFTAFSARDEGKSLQVEIMYIPELCYQDQLLEQKARLRAEKKRLGNGPKNIAACKKAIAKFLASTELIATDFSGKLIISFKEGGVSYIEKVEQIK